MNPKDHMPLKDKEARAAYHKQYMQKWYAKNKKKHISYVAKNRATHRDRIAQWLSEMGKKLECSICLEDHVACMDFHHRNPEEKEFNIAHGNIYYSKEKVLKELAKCDILCSNCHRKLHYNQRTQNK